MPVQCNLTFSNHMCLLMYRNLETDISDLSCFLILDNSSTEEIDIKRHLTTSYYTTWFIHDVRLEFREGINWVVKGSGNQNSGNLRFISAEI